MAPNAKGTKAEPSPQERSQCAAVQQVTQGKSQEAPILTSAKLSADQIYSRLITEAPHISGFKDDQYAPLDDIPWVDRSLLQIGHDFQQDYYAMLYACSGMIAIMSITCVRPVTGMVFREMESQLDPLKNYLKFIQKFEGVDRMYQTILSDGKREFYRIRKVHAIAAANKPKYHEGRPLPEIVGLQVEPWMHKVSAAVRKDMEEIMGISLEDEAKRNPLWNYISCWDTPQVPISQLDVICAAFSFGGWMCVAPHVLGFPNRDDPRFKGIIHLWAVFCRMIGVRDEYNVFIEVDPQVMARFARDAFLGSMAALDVTSIAIQNVTVEEFMRHAPVPLPFTARSLLYQALKILTEGEIFGCSQDKSTGLENLWKILSWKDKMGYFVTSMAIKLGRKSSLVRLLAKQVAFHFLSTQFKTYMPKKGKAFQKT